MKMKKCFCLVLTLAMFISLLAGCSQTKSTTSDSGTAIPNTTTDPASAASSSEKDTLIIAVNEDISGLDPFAQNTSLQNTYTILNYDCLLSLNPQTGAVEKNGLATDYDIISPTEYVFHLREGVKFHEGQTLKASDVKYSIERAAASAGMASKVSQVDHVEVIDDLTVKIVLNTPSTTILNNLAFCGTSIMCEEWCEAHKDNFKHNGTGPYKFVAWKSGESFEVTRFDDYWGEPAKMKNLKFVVMTEDNARTIALETGEVDVLAQVPMSDFNRFKENSDVEVYSVPSTCVYYMSLNHQMEPTSNLKVRQAIAYAINKQDLIDVYLEGLGSVKNTILGDGQSYCDNNVSGYEYNPDKGKALLAEAGYPNGFDLTCTVSESNVVCAQLIQNQLSAIGINFKIDQAEHAVRSDLALSGKMACTIGSWQPATSDADNPLRNILYSKSMWSNNEGCYNNPEYDATLDEALKETDPVKAQALYTKCQEIIRDDVAVIPLFASMWTIAAHKNVKGVVIPAVGDAMIYKDMYWES